LQVPKATTGRGAWNLGKSSWKFHCKNLEKPCENVMKAPNSWVWNGMIFGGLRICWGPFSDIFAKCPGLIVGSRNAPHNLPGPFSLSGPP
jgi:hypothetical protein